MIYNHIILAILWILYCVLHSVLADSGFKRRVQRMAGSGYRYYRLFYTLFAFLSLIAVLWFQLTIISPWLLKVSTVVVIIAALAGMAGVILMAVCIKKYFMSLSGLKSLFVAGHSHELIITGVHRYMRHPLYLGTFLFIWALFLVQPYLSLLIANAVITVYTIYAIRFEEQKLVEEFGPQYRDYMERVPMLVPSFRAMRRKSRPDAGK